MRAEENKSERANRPKCVLPVQTVPEEPEEGFLK